MGTGIPPRHGGGKLNVYRLGERETVRLVVLSPQLVLCPCHGGRNVTLLCPGFTGRFCPLCDTGQRARLERWAEVRHEEPRRHVMQSFTQGAVENCPALLDQVDAARGLVVVLSKLAGKYGGVRAEVVGRREKHWQGLPPATCDVRRWLLSFYRHDMPGSPAMALFRDNAGIHTQDISNVSEEVRPDPSETTPLSDDSGPVVLPYRRYGILWGVLPPDEEGDGDDDADDYRDDQAAPPAAEASAAPPPPAEPPRAGGRRLTPAEVRDWIRQATSRGPHSNNGHAG